MKYAALKNFINGEFVASKSTRKLQVISPVDGSTLSDVTMSSTEDLHTAVEAARTAFHKWSRTPIKERVQVFFRYKFLLEKRDSSKNKLSTKLIEETRVLILPKIQSQFSFKEQ